MRIFVADKGIQVPIRGAKLLLYSMPPLIFLVLRCFHCSSYNFICSSVLGDHEYLDQHQEDILLWEPAQVENLALMMVFLHFSKLLFETLRLQRLSGRMISLNMVFWEGFMYWFVLGVCVGFQLHHTDYLPASVFADQDFGIRSGNPFKIMIFAVFIMAEVMNF